MRRMTGGDGDKVRRGCRNVQPAIATVAPGDESGVGFHHEIFRAAGIEDDGAIQGWRHLGQRTIVKIAPRDNRAIGFERGAEVGATGDGDDVAETNRNIALAVAIPTPGYDGP